MARAFRAGDSRCVCDSRCDSDKTEERATADTAATATATAYPTKKALLGTDYVTKYTAAATATAATIATPYPEGQALRPRTLCASKELRRQEHQAPHGEEEECRCHRQTPHRQGPTVQNRHDTTRNRLKDAQRLRIGEQEEDKRAIETVFRFDEHTMNLHLYRGIRSFKAISVLSASAASPYTTWGFRRITSSSVFSSISGRGRGTAFTPVFRTSTAS